MDLKPCKKEDCKFYDKRVQDNCTFDDMKNCLKQKQGGG